jgi:hypothetical protein
MSAISFQFHVSGAVVISPSVQTQRNHVTILTSASAPASSRHSRDTDLPVSQVLVLFAQFLHDNTTAWDPSLTSLGIGYQNRATKSEFEVRYSAHRSPCRISHLRAVGHLVVAVQPYDAEHVADLGAQRSWQSGFPASFHGHGRVTQFGIRMRCNPKSWRPLFTVQSRFFLPLVSRQPGLGAKHGAEPRY